MTIRFAIFDYLFSCLLLITLKCHTVQGLSLVRELDPFEYEGLWEGVDPLDGANMQRAFILESEEGGTQSYSVTGRIEFSEICAGLILADNETIASNNIIPGSINGFGQADIDTELLEGINSLSEQQLNATVSVSCFAEEEPRVRGLSVTYVPHTKDIIKEIPIFRQDVPIYLFRMSPSVRSPMEKSDDSSCSRNPISTGNFWWVAVGIVLVQIFSVSSL